MAVKVNSKLTVGVKVVDESSIECITFVTDIGAEVPLVTSWELAVIVKAPVDRILKFEIFRMPAVVVPDLVPVQEPLDIVKVIE